MIIEELHYEIRRRWDMSSGLHKRTLTPLEIDNAIFEATQDYIEMYVYGSKMDVPYVKDMEWNRKRSDMTQPFIVSYPEQPVLVPTPLTDGMYSYNLTSTVKPYRSYIESSVTVPDCSTFFEVKVVQHEDISNILKDYHMAPSKQWKRAIGAIRDNKLYVYTNLLFTPTTLRLTFVRQPSRPCIGTYGFIPTSDNPAPVGLKPKVESDIPEGYHNLLVRMTVQKLQHLFGEPNYQTSEMEINKVT